MAPTTPQSIPPLQLPGNAQKHDLVRDAQLETSVAQLIRTTPAILLGLIAACAIIWWSIGDRLSLRSHQVQLWLAFVVFSMAVRSLPLFLRLTGKQAWINAHLWHVALCIVFGAALIAISTVAMPLLNWAQMSSAEQAVMAGMIVGIITFGAMTMAPIPYGAYLWLVLVGSVLVGFTLQIDIPKMNWVPWTIVAWCLFLAVIARQFGSAFRALITARAEAAHHAEMVALLLQDFGEEARDWLWETVRKSARYMVAYSRMHFAKWPIPVMR
jgi:two-component system, sensor histidine kinase